MSYSTIVKKKCKCGCHRWPTISCEGYNYVCAPEDIKEKLGSRRKLNEKNKRIRIGIAAKLRQAQNEVHKSDLDRWFDKIASKHLIEEFCGIGCFCSECGSWIPEKYIRHATSHLLPKKNFISVSTHELNYLILGAGCGCHEKTHRLDTFVKMKVWPEAARRIKIMMPLLPFDELKYISSQLLNALDNVTS